MFFWWLKNKVERNKAVKVICNAKCEYFNDAFDANKNNSKSMWKTIKSLTGGKKNAQSVSCFKEGDCIIDDTKGMADLFNIHFASTAGSLRSTLPSANWNFDNLHNFVNSRKHPDVLFPVPTVTIHCRNNFSEYQSWSSCWYSLYQITFIEDSSSWNSAFCCLA